MTVGGAIAADVHGKNHHRAGSFAGSSCPGSTCCWPDGSEQRITPAGQPDLFWATAGGMGLTGIILRAGVQLKRVETSRLNVDTVRTADIDETMAYLSATDDRYGYTVAWTDCLARGGQLGRSVITSGDFAALARPGPVGPAGPAGVPARRAAQRPGRVPQRAAERPAPSGWPTRLTTAGRRAGWTRQIQTIGQFFHPLDGIRNWNRVYGPAGFRQYQFVVPFGAERLVRRALERISAARAPSFVTVLKRFGPADPGFLSFPLAGWTLALDFPARTPGLDALLDQLDAEVLDAGGRVYLAKDSRVRPEVLAQMYPRLDEFRKLRAELDPEGLFASDLSRRLGLETLAVSAASGSRLGHGAGGPGPGRPGGRPRPRPLVPSRRAGPARRWPPGGRTWCSTPSTSRGPPRPARPAGSAPPRPAATTNISRSAAFRRGSG